MVRVSLNSSVCGDEAFLLVSLILLHKYQEWFHLSEIVGDGRKLSHCDG
jgi:hypothetical protein